MTPLSPTRLPDRRSATAWLLLLLLLPMFRAPGVSAAEELRGLWVDTFHPALRDESEARQLVAAARSGGFNALFVEVRKRGDAYYDSRFEPRASDIGPGFDPLQRLLGLAHDITAGPRLEVHAWIVAFNIWNQESVHPPQSDHPYRRHPEWLTRNFSGARWDGANYAFDPGHPEVQRHTFDVAMDLVSRYEIDGLHWDYIRYAGRDWGYNDVAVRRFNQRFGRTGKPSPNDADWLRFRRDQVTALVRKVYLTAFARKPHIKISAATITFAPGIATTEQWPASAAYSDVLQDWRAWMEEGILDWNIPMAYFRQAEFPEAFARWITFAKDHQYRRRTAIGLGAYLNPISQTLRQIDQARQPSPLGNSPAGLLAYSYASLALDLPTDATLAVLARPSSVTEDPPFAAPAIPPSTPWKTSRLSGHLEGWVVRSVDDSPIEDAVLTLEGPTQATLRTDATGFFGAVDLPAGDYLVRVAAPGFQSASADASVRGARATHLEFPLVAVDPANPGDIRASAGSRTAAISWTTASSSTGWVELRDVSPDSPSMPRRWDAGLPGPRHSIQADGLLPDTSYEFVVHARTIAPSVDATVSSSETRYFRTAGSVVIDNPRAHVTGGWALASAGTAGHGDDCRVANTVRTSSIPSVATFETHLPTPGLYAVETWFPASADRTRQAPFEVLDDSGSRFVAVDQTVASGRWVPLVPEADFRSDLSATVRLRNNTGETGRTVVADAVRWRYLEANDAVRSNQLPPWWALHFLGSVDSNPADDFDGDGLSNASEHWIGTDPTIRASVLAIGPLSPTLSGWRIGYRPKLLTRSYRLQVREAAAPSAWRTAEASHAFDDRGGGWIDVGTPTPTPTSTLFRIRADSP